MPKRTPILLAKALNAPHYTRAFHLKTIKNMKLFAALRKIREFERLQLPFLKSVIDLDIVIQIGYAEEEGQPLKLKQLYLLKITSRSTVRRRLARLIRTGNRGAMQTDEGPTRGHSDDLFFRPQSVGQVWRCTYHDFGSNS